MPRLCPAVRSIGLFAASFLLAAGVGCREDARPPVATTGGGPSTAPAQAAATTRPATRPFESLADDRLHNAHRVTAKVISGAQPEGEESFKRLRDLGVKTIISVDGAAPDVETARKYGMRYVHLPVTYATVTPEQGRAVAKAIDELPGPIYVHCHHGKHRSAAAVAVACVYNGSLAPDEAESVLQTFGTGENYTGLWKAARDARPVAPGELAGLKVDFAEVTKIPPLAEAMVAVDERLDELKLAQSNKWQAPTIHPDLDPPHAALQLEEHLHEIGRSDGAKGKANPEEFTRLLAASEKEVHALGGLLGAKPIDAPAADAALKRVAASCTACHKAYRE